MRKKAIFRVLLGLLALIILFAAVSYAFFLIDGSRAEKGQSPLFCLRRDSMNDGGSQVFYGLGYQIISWHTIREDGIYSGIEKHYLTGIINPLKDSPQIELTKTETE